MCITVIVFIILLISCENNNNREWNVHYNIAIENNERFVLEARKPSMLPLMSCSWRWCCVFHVQNVNIEISFDWAPASASSFHWLAPRSLPPVQCFHFGKVPVVTIKLILSSSKSLFLFTGNNDMFDNDMLISPTIWIDEYLSYTEFHNVIHKCEVSLVDLLRTLSQWDRFQSRIILINQVVNTLYYCLLSQEILVTCPFIGRPLQRRLLCSPFVCPPPQSTFNESNDLIQFQWFLPTVIKVSHIRA